MASKIRIGLVGYGNIGKGAAKAVTAAPDMELKAIFTRRNPESMVAADSSISDSGALLLPLADAGKMVNDIDVMMLCGGSATDLPEQAPQIASMFNTVDSFDTHAKIPEYMASIDAVAKNTTAIISTGWDPGLFSMMRILFESTLPGGAAHTFWGEGLSQGHTNAVRRIEGVKYAAQYTIPIEDAVRAARRGEGAELGAYDKHIRECFVVAEPGADTAKIEETIKTMPNYFAGYKTIVNFIDDDEFLKNHTKMPHGGMVIHSGTTGEGLHKNTMEFSLKLDSNPEFTASIMTSYARAVFRMSQEGLFGAKTVYDVPLSYLTAESREGLIKRLL